MRINLGTALEKGVIARITVVAIAMIAQFAGAVQVACPAASAAALQACINSAHPNDPADLVMDTVVVQLNNGVNYGGAQVRINHRRNLWIIGDTTPTTLETALPRIVFQDKQHTYTDLDTSLRNDTTAAGTYGQNNGAVWVYLSDNIRIQGVLVDGAATYVAAIAGANRIFAYGATLGHIGTPVEIRGNVGINVLDSRNVQIRYTAIRNTWDGISIVSPNLGGAFAFPDPNDPLSEVVSTLPTSRAGLYGSHLVERCKIHDNTFGVLCQRDWDLSSVFRNNLFWNNYLRHWGDPKTVPGYSAGTVAPTSEYITNLYALDVGLHADGSRRSLAFTTVGGAFLMTDVALTPYRIHNNTFQNNATIFSGYYKTGTQHLFYNNLVGRPYQFFRKAVNLPVQGTDLAGTGWTANYTATERNSEMLQYFAEHQRSNRVVDQDDTIPTGGTVTTSQAVAPNYWGPDDGKHFRLYNMRMIRTNTGNWVNGSGRSWNNESGTQDSVGMTWVPDTTASGTIAQIADTGGIVNWVRQNMWTGAAKDPTMDPNPPDGTNGSHWSPPWVPTQIRNALGDPTIFRNTSTFDIRWTYQLPLNFSSATLPTTWLKPIASTTSHIKLSGWPTYEGTANAGGVITPLSIGAYDSATGNWAAPSRRLVLRDTLIESVDTNGMIKFKLNVSGQGISDSDIVKLEVSSSKFYNDVPVSDTFYNQGPVVPGSPNTTTRVNSILSRKPWPLPYDFQKPDYDRAGYNVDDTLTKNKLSPDNLFEARIANPAKWLPSDSLYARAEVVLKATLKDETVIYSNPGVFMFSRPRFQFTVTVTDINGKPLPKDGDSISLDVVAGQPLLVKVKAKLGAAIPVAFKGFANLQIGNLGSLVGPDGNQFDILPLQSLTGTNFSPVHANDTIIAFFNENDSVRGVYHAMASPSDGTLTYSAVFQASDNSLLPYFIQGRSSPLKVVSGSIYQVTIDSVYRKTDTALLISPKVSIKLDTNARDTILSDGKDTSRNIASAFNGDTLRVVMQVRDRYGNPVMGKDSVSAKKGIYIQLASILATRYPTDPAMLQMDSTTGTVWLNPVQLSFDSTGRATAYVLVSAASKPLGSLRAALVDATGQELGTGTNTRDKGIPDTTWVSVQPSALGIQWVDTLNHKAFLPFTGTVGSWYPVQLGSMNNGLPNAYTGSIPLTLLSALHFHPARGDTSTVTSATFTGTAFSQILWLRADDSTSVGWIQAVSAVGTDRVEPLKFSYPQVLSSSFYDANCDGLIDSLVVKFNGPLAFRNASGVVSGDALDALFPHQFLSPSAKGAPARFTLLDSATLAFGWTEGTLGAADASANSITVGNPLSGKTISYTLTNLLDKAPPQAMKAVDIQSSVPAGAQDSLVVTFSEGIVTSDFTTGAIVPFTVIRGGSVLPLTGAHLIRPVQVLDSGVYAFVFQAPTSTIAVGDLLKPIGDSISDLAGNLASAGCNPAAPIYLTNFNPLPGYVIDVNGDGNADSVHLSFKDSIGTLPNQIKVQWGTPAETLTVTKAQLLAMGVKSSDSSFTVPTVNWHGQTVVIDGDTVHNAPRTTGKLDTAIYDGVLGVTLLDRVPPVVIHARLHYGPSVQVGVQGYDTLNVDFSETVSGCAVGTDASVCLSQKGAGSSKPFPTGSTIISASGTGWVLLVPQGSIHIGTDSLRGTPASQSGKLKDVSASANAAGNGASWVAVLGDPPPPNHGWMLDQNGDGKVDAVLLSFLNPPPFATLPTYQFEWGNASGAAVTLTSGSAVALDSTRLRWIVTLTTPGDFGATGYPLAATKMLGLQPTSTPYRFWVSDSAGPVLKPPAILKPSSDSIGSDTLIVTASEALLSPTNSVLLEFKRGGQVISAGNVSFLSATPLGNGTWKVVLAPLSSYRPNPGDSVRLSTSGSVRDSSASQNVPSPKEPWVVLTGSLRMPYASYYYDHNKDGRIDSVTLSFAAPPAVGSIVRVADPAGSGTTKDFVVPASDSASKTISFGFASSQWGQNVTSWTNTNLGTLMPAAGTDTSVVHSGKFSILDRVEPVIVSAVIRYTGDTSSVDTMTIVFSENVKIDSTKFLLQSKHAGSTGDSGSVVMPVYFKYDSATKTLTVYLRPVPDRDTVNPGVGDSLRLTLAVTDLLGNSPQKVAKWTSVTGNTRIFPPSVNLSNSILSNDNKVGDPVVDESGQPQTTLPLVTRWAQPGNDGDWKLVNPDGTTKDLGTAYKPGTADYNTDRGGKTGTVIFVPTNVPLQLTLYIYDNVGTYVTSQRQEITQAMIDGALKNLPNDSTKSSIGLVDFGMRWMGQDAKGRQVASGIYPARLIAYRNPTAQEKAAGTVNSLMYNRLVRVGVKLKIQQ
jgi:hypothetical protein